MFTHQLIAKPDNSTAIHRCLNSTQKSNWDEWYNQAPPRWKNWIDSHHFSPSHHNILNLPDANHKIESILQTDSGNSFDDGAHASKLPAGCYHLDAADAETTEHYALGWALANYQFNNFRKTKQSAPARAELAIADDHIRARVIALADATALVRDLINTPANIMTPEGLEQSATELAHAYDAAITVTTGDALAKRFPAIHTVGRAAEIAPRLIDMTWGDKGPRITCIGKGITFDSGGLDIKPSSGMEIMKKDMGGAAHVLGLAKAIMAMGLDIRLRVLIPAAENAISALAMRPLDIIDTAAGIPVEVGNTDAEGRLVLADALHLATQQDNDLLIDFATLTGAARVALGTELPAMFTNQDELAQAMTLHAQKTHDPVWRLPLHAPYGKQLDQGHAAFSSTGASRYGGAITAALFLERFLATPQPWMHFDVMAWNLGARPGRPKGGEAMAMRAVFSLISDMANT